MATCGKNRASSSGEISITVSRGKSNKDSDGPAPIVARAAGSWARSRFGDPASLFVAAVVESSRRGAGPRRSKIELYTEIEVREKKIAYLCPRSGYY